MALTEIGTLDLCGEKVKLGKNGNVRLVREKIDAWGNKYGIEVDLWEWLISAVPGSDLDGEAVVIQVRAQALLDELGKALMGFNLSKDRQ